VSLATSVLPFKTRETVDTEKPAVLATSRIVTARLFFCTSNLGKGCYDYGNVTGNVTVIIS